MSAATGDTSEDSTLAPVSRLWWAVPAVSVILLGMFALLFGGGPESIDFGTSYDASNNGFRAAFLLLDELKYPVERSRRPTGGEIRWVLFPTKIDAKVGGELDDWVKRGGIALLAIDDPEPALAVGLTITTTGNRRFGESKSAAVSFTASAGRGDPSEDVSSLSSVSVGVTEVRASAGERSWGRVDGRPLVSIYPRGRGEVWLLHRPDVLTNANLRTGEDNSILVCRLAEAMLRERPRGRLAFDEYTHGLRDRPGVIELLFRPPMLAVTLEVLLLAALAVWHFGVPFGPVRPAPPPARRSKEEFLHAMAELLTRKGDRAEAFRTVRDDLLRRIEADLGLSASTPVEQVVEELVRRRGVNPEPLLQLLTANAPPQGHGVGAFLAAMHQLETAANECLQSRRRPR